MALNPDLRMLSLIRELSEYPQLLMIGVNDGSDASYNSAFCTAAKANRVLVYSLLKQQNLERNYRGLVVSRKTKRCAMIILLVIKLISLIFSNNISNAALPIS